MNVDSAENRLVTVFGGSGFLGRHAVRALAKAGWRIRVACRRPDLAFHLQPLGRVGQIQTVQANLRHPPSVQAAVSGAAAVVNLAGILIPAGRQSFEAVHRFGAATVARAARASGTTKLIHVSAIGADSGSESAYYRTKAEAEALVSEYFPDATIVRPSVMFGPEDDFFNRFAAIARLSPVLPLIGDGQTKFQPVYVGDVAAAIREALQDSSANGCIYELGGPEVRTFEDLLAYICTTIGRKRFMVPAPWPLARLNAFCLEMAHKLSLGLWPDWLTLTRDQIAMLRTDNIVSPNAVAEGRTLAAFGITPEAMEAIVPAYLYRYRKTGQFQSRHAT